MPVVVPGCYCPGNVRFVGVRQAAQPEDASLIWFVLRAVRLVQETDVYFEEPGRLTLLRERIEEGFFGVWQKIVSFLVS